MGPYLVSSCPRRSALYPQAKRAYWKSDSKGRRKAQSPAADGPSLRTAGVDDDDGSAKWSTALYKTKARAKKTVKRPAVFRRGDRVTVVKSGSSHKGEAAEVTDPNWNGLIKVTA